MTKQTVFSIPWMMIKIAGNTRIELVFSDRKSDVLTVAPADQRKGDT